MNYRPMWKYNHKDKTTWKYMDYEIKKDNGEDYIKWVVNLKFAYEHLSPYGNEILWNLVDKDIKCH